MCKFGAVTARLYAWMNRNPPSNRIVVDLLALGPDDRVLEVGCGPGAATALAAERIGADRIAAVDPSPTFVDQVRRRVAGADVRVGGAEQLPFDDGAFTAIWSIASMHHWADRDAGLSEVTRKLAPGGRLLLAERLLQRRGHGITPDETSDVLAYLDGLGYAEISTVHHPNGRKTLQVIHATR